jgi:protein-tyrosine-phosphatase
MAEAITAHLMPDSLKGTLVVSSAGTATCDGLRAAPHAIEVLREMGIDLTGHRTRVLTEKMLEEADLVIAMTEDHRRQILRLSPESNGKVILFGELDRTRADPDMADPIGGDEDAYRMTREEINGLVPRLFDYLIDIFKVTK